MLNLINAYLASIGANPISPDQYAEILDILSVHKVEAIKRLRNFTRGTKHVFLKARPGGFQDYLLYHNIDSLAYEERIGLKEAKEIIDFIGDNWEARNIE